MRVGHQRAADREHLLLAAGELVAHVVGALRQAREQREHPLERPRLARAAAVVGERDEVLAHRQVGEDLPALGHERDAACARCGPADGRSMRSPRNVIAPPRAGVRPRIERTVVVLPMPLRPSSVATSPARISSDDAEQHLARAVGGLEASRPRAVRSFTATWLFAQVRALHLRVRRGSRRAGRSRSRARSRAPRCGRRAGTPRPCRARSSSTVIRAFRPSISAIMRSDSSGPMPAIGSSSSSSFGRVASASPTSSWRCSPCARLPAGDVCSRPASPTCREHARAPRRRARAPSRAAARTRGSSRCAPARRARRCRAR